MQNSFNLDLRPGQVTFKNGEWRLTLPAKEEHTFKFDTDVTKGVVGEENQVLCICTAVSRSTCSLAGLTGAPTAEAKTESVQLRSKFHTNIP